MRLFIRDLSDFGVNVLANSKEMKTEKKGKLDEHQCMRWNFIDTSEKSVFLLLQKKLHFEGDFCFKWNFINLATKTGSNS